jgi:hypothetical protein
VGNGLNGALGLLGVGIWLIPAAWQAASGAVILLGAVLAVEYAVLGAQSAWRAWRRR